jgi:hypothetical protein
MLNGMWKGTSLIMSVSRYSLLFASQILIASSPNAGDGRVVGECYRIDGSYFIKV